jgi:hypothetical protein
MKSIDMKSIDMKNTLFEPIILSLFFFVGASSDVVLNFLSRQTYAPLAVKALKEYFQRKSIQSPFLRLLISAINAGLTIVVALLITAIMAQWLLAFTYPATLKQLGLFLALAFPIGYAADTFIYKTELFGPTLNHYYKLAGVGFWGAAAFIFSILSSFTLLYLGRHFI